MTNDQTTNSNDTPATNPGTSPDEPVSAETDADQKESVKISKETADALGTVIKSIFDGIERTTESNRKFHRYIFSRTYLLISLIIAAIFVFSGFLMSSSEHFNAGFSLLTHTLAIVAGAIAVASSFRPPSE